MNSKPAQTASVAQGANKDNSQKRWAPPRVIVSELRHTNAGKTSTSTPFTDHKGNPPNFTEFGS